jgi:hypothetical protein
MQMDDTNIASDEKIDVSDIDLVKSHSANAYMADKAMESNFLDMKELNDALPEQGTFLANVYVSIEKSSLIILTNCHSVLVSRKQVMTCMTIT